MTKHMSEKVFLKCYISFSCSDLLLITQLTSPSWVCFACDSCWWVMSASPYTTHESFVNFSLPCQPMEGRDRAALVSVWHPTRVNPLHKTKALKELNLTKVMKGIKQSFCREVGDKKKAGENMGPLWKVPGYLGHGDGWGTWWFFCQQTSPVLGWI